MHFLWHSSAYNWIFMLSGWTENLVSLTRFMWMAYSHFAKCLTPSVASQVGGRWKSLLHGGRWEAGPFELLVKSFVAVLIAGMRSMGLWEMLSRAAKARKGRGIKTGVMLMTLVDAPIASGVELTPALPSLVVALSAFSPGLVV